MQTKEVSYHGYRFPREIISHGVWLYHRFALSFRDVEELLAKRGVIVSYETVRQWCRKFGPEYAQKYCQLELILARLDVGPFENRTEYRHFA